MPSEVAKERTEFLDQEVHEFLERNPKAAETLRLFGITMEHYKQVLEAQNRPVFYTAHSTNPGGSNGQLA